MAAKKRTEVKEGDTLAYVRQNSGMTTAEGFVLRPGVPIAVGDKADVTVAFGQMLVDDGHCVIEGKWRDDEVEEAAKAEEEAASVPVVTAFEPPAVSEATAVVVEEPVNADDSRKDKDK